MNKDVVLSETLNKMNDILEWVKEDAIRSPDAIAKDIVAMYAITLEAIDKVNKEGKQE